MTELANLKKLKETRHAGSFQQIIPEANSGNESLKKYEESNYEITLLYSKIDQQKKEIEDAYEKLKELDKQKSDFFDNMSHEFRTPLTLSIAPMEHILTGALGNTIPHNHEFLTTIYNNSLRLLKLVNELLDISRMSNNKMTVQYMRCDLNTLFKFYLSTMDSVLKMRKIEIQYRELTSPVEL